MVIGVLNHSLNDIEIGNSRSNEIQHEKNVWLTNYHKNELKNLLLQFKDKING